MLGEKEDHQPFASKESVVSADTSFQSVCGSLCTADVRRPSSATSYSFGSISGNNLKHASVSFIGTLATGEIIGSVPSDTAGGVVANSQRGSQLNGGTQDPPPRMAEEDQITSVDDHLQRSNGRLGTPTTRSLPVTGKLIHPGIEIFNYDIGRPPHDRHFMPPLQLPRYSGPTVVSSFNPTHAFLVTRTGTPGLSRDTGGSHKHHLLKSRGWEIREVSGAIRRCPNDSSKFQRAGTGGIGGKNATAELALESVTDEVFGVWGCWANTGSHSPWRCWLDSLMLPATPSTSSLLSHIRTPVLQTPKPRSPSLAPSSVDMQPSLDSRAGSLAGPLHFPPDPAYVSLKTNPASSKSTFYSIETIPLISTDFRFPKVRAEPYQSETGRIPISQWKVPYNINSPSTITLLNYYDSQHNQQHGHKPRPQKSKKVEVWAAESDFRTQFFEMDTSTYTWEFRVRPKMKVPISTGSHPSYTLSARPTTQSSRKCYPPLPVTLGTPASIPAIPIGIHSSYLGGRSSLEHGVQKVVKYRSECLVLVKEVDRARYIIAEYYFPKTIKSTTVTPGSVTGLRRFTSSPTTPGSSSHIYEASPNQPPPTPSTTDLPSPSFKAKEKVHYTNIGRHQPGILLLDARAVNKVLALNSLLLTLKREKQRKIVTLNASSDGFRTRRWSYGVYDNDLLEEGESKRKEVDSVEENHKREGNGHDALEIGSSLDPGYLQRHDITISVSSDGDDVREWETARKHRNPTPELDDYSLQGDDWEYDETEGWKRRGHSFAGSSKGGVG